MRNIKSNLPSVEDYSVDTLNKLNDYIESPQFDQVILGKGEFLTKGFKRKHDSLGTFQAIGKINHMHTIKHTTTDVFDLLDGVSKSIYSLFNSIKNKRDPLNNLAYINYPTDKNEMKVFSRHIVVLKKRTILKRVSKGIFIINPFLIKPVEYKSAITLWESLP